MKRGSKVAVCYDGKWSRRVQGTVLATRHNYRILVEFPEYANESNVIQHWFRVQAPERKWGQCRYFAGYVPVERSVMRGLFGAPGDYYTVNKWRD